MFNQQEMKKANLIRMLRILKILLIIAGVILGIYLLYKISFYIMPFIIAFILASIIEPLIRFLMRKLKLPRKVIAPVILLVFVGALGVIISLVIARLIREAGSFAYAIPGMISSAYKYITYLINEGVNMFEWLPPEFTDRLLNSLGSLATSLSARIPNVVSSITKGAYITAISIPEGLLFTIITLLSTYFLCSDRDRISNFFSTHFPEKWINKVKTILNDMFSALLAYIKAQLVLIFITFTELFIGFSIMRVRYSLLLAVIISILDALPILGTGGFLIPWAIYSFFAGNIKMGISLLILYGIVIAVRQLIEPKLVSNQIGIHPLLTLISMYTSLQIFGFIGLILGPIMVLVLKNILSGVLKNKTLKDILEAKGKEISRNN